MESTTRVPTSLPQFAPYDPADSPGPIPSVIERFRPRPYQPGEEDPDGPEATARRYAVVLVTPEHAEVLKHRRCDAGLKLYVDDEWESDVIDLFEAATDIERMCGFPVTLVEHHADLTYWTARPRES
jgi:hypothetical protein